LVALALFLFVGALAVIMAPIGLPGALFDRLRYRAFRRREAGRVYLVCTPRRNWHDFIRNNVIPIVPDHYRVVWSMSQRGGSPSVLLGEFMRGHNFGIPKPYLVLVTPRGLVHRSLNATLAALKQHQERSERVQAACREAIGRVEAELRSGAADRVLA
jgi:hypothetical protein